MAMTPAGRAALLSAENQDVQERVSQVRQKIIRMAPPTRDKIEEGERVIDTGMVFWPPHGCSWVGQDSGGLNVFHLNESVADEVRAALTELYAAAGWTIEWTKSSGRYPNQVLMRERPKES